MNQIRSALLFIVNVFEELFILVYASAESLFAISADTEFFLQRKMESCPQNVETELNGGQNVEMELNGGAEMKEETTSLRDLQAKLTKEVQDPANSVAAAEARRYVFVGNVDRLTIKGDKSGKPKGYAYVEEGAVQNVILLNRSVLHYRQLKVTAAKRTNIPGMKLQDHRYGA